ncbi:hypothetical protein THRCLA_05996 [Thraustotheca clavata]|uniref:Tudor domain-containing protein n=1 Tax=Thraustotheca clavata TaxID=74557 RepID=A0A1V9ZQU3_9STRA|nr:hypothetical protein THRCLA_05996 [Thraustotheca clavata]
MSEYEDSFEDFDEKSSPRKSVHESVEAIYEDESFEAESHSPKKLSSTFVKGDVVEVYWDHEESWYRGRVKKVDPPNFFIVYEDGDTQWEDVKSIRYFSVPRLPTSVVSTPMVPMQTTSLKYLSPRPYSAVAEHYSIEKIAKPYISVMNHPISSTYLTPKKYASISTMKECCNCPSHSCYFITPRSTYKPVQDDEIHHPILKPCVIKRSTQTSCLNE